MRSRRWLLAVGAVGVVAAASAGTIMAANAGETAGTGASVKAAAGNQPHSVNAGEVTCTDAPMYPYVAQASSPDGRGGEIVSFQPHIEMRITCTAAIPRIFVRMYNEHLLQQGSEGSPEQVEQMWSGNFESLNAVDTAPMVVNTYSNYPSNCDKATQYRMRAEIYYTWADGSVTEAPRTLPWTDLGKCSTWDDPPPPPPGPPAPPPGPGPGQPIPPGPGQPFPPRPF